MTTERQMSQLRLWANGTDFVLDPESSPKREFARLAQACGWVGGGAEWNRRWRQTFDEEYGYIPRNDSYRDNSMHRETGSHRNTDSDWDLISNEGSHSGSSDYSVIGAEGGVVLYQTPAPTVTLLNEFERLAIQNANSVEVRSTAPVSTRNRPKKPATQQNKSGMSKKQRRAQALEADFCTFFGSDLDGLDGWQKLCEIVGVSSNRKSVTQYKKALKSVHINLVNLVQHCRNPEATPLLKFASHKEFRDYTTRGKSRIFPKAAAKSNPFLKALLKQVF